MSLVYHENQIPLDRGAILWRYLDRDKLESLLKDRALFFCRADKFSDPFEGSLPRREANYRLIDARRVDEFFQRPFNPAVALQNIAGIGNLHRRFKSATVMNCWHINQNESDAMWCLYLKDNEGVAIQTTADKMAAAITACKEPIECSKVRYIDYTKDIWYDPDSYPHKSYNMIIPFVHKRKEYQHENEFRLYQTIQEAIDDPEYWLRQPLEKGKLIPIDIEALIDEIILPPTSDQGSQAMILDLCTRYGFNFRLRPSALNQDPIF